MYENEVEYTVSIKIDGESVSDNVEEVSINMSEDDYVNTVSVRFNEYSWDLFGTLCEPFLTATTAVIITDHHLHQELFLLCMMLHPNIEIILDKPPLALLQFFVVE